MATVLLADHQTTGGFPKIATVIGPDLDGLAQRRSGDQVRFAAVTAADAVVAARADATDVDDDLASIVLPGHTLSHRLRQQNLIGGAGDPAGER